MDHYQVALIISWFNVVQKSYRTNRFIIGIVSDFILCVFLELRGAKESLGSLPCPYLSATKRSDIELQMHLGLIRKELGPRGA